MKRTVSLFIALLLFVSVWSVGFAARAETPESAYAVMRIDQLYAVANGAKARVSDTEDLAPVFNETGRTMIPFRFLVSCFGCDVDWDGGTGSVIIIYKGKEIVIPIGKYHAYVDGVQTPISAPAQIMAFGRTFIPLRAVTELMGDIYLDYAPGTMTIIAADSEIDDAQPYVDIYENLVEARITTPTGNLNFNVTHFVYNSNPFNGSYVFTSRDELDKVVGKNALTRYDENYFEHSILAVFVRQYNTGGYSFNVDSVVGVSATDIKINATMFIPPFGSGVIQVLTNVGAYVEITKEVWCDRNVSFDIKYMVYPGY